MDAEEYAYDVAFSFLKEDEELATELNDLLQDRLRTFLYSKRQEEIAGTDGERTFNRVFGEEARLVVVLYREAWGETPWTRIEETAIRNRAFEHGHDFLTLIPLGKPPSVPKWLPKTRIWVGLDRWGPPGAASVIEARVQEAGGAAREETVEDRAARLEREIAREQTRQAFLHSETGVNSANAAVQELYQELGRVAASAIAKVRFTIGAERDREGYHVHTQGYHVYVTWLNAFANTLRDSVLSLTLRRQPRFSIGQEQWDTLLSLEFDFDLQGATAGWRQRSPQGRFLDTRQLAQHCVKLLLERLGDDKPWQNWF